MFGNGSSFNNIFGGITESHLRLFGGDRALATKDIEGITFIMHNFKSKKGLYFQSCIKVNVS